MTRNLKILVCLLLGMTAAGHAFGFSMWGPTETWQTQDLDYGIRYLPMLPLPDGTIDEVLGPGSIAAFNTELGGTKNLGEGSRLNVPIITYAYDSTFLNYFGTKGEAAIDSAFAVLNGLPDASTVGSKMTGFLTTGNQQVNYTAEALRMIDLKSIVLWLMMEHMGLIGETHTYDLRERVADSTAGAATCSFYYVIFQRNFDPVTYNPSEYVNGTLLTYQIGDLCPQGISVGDAMEQAAQIGSPPFSSVATREALQVGGYYLRITRDDMGGLRYLYNPQRYVNEGLDTNVAVATQDIVGFNPINTAVSNAPVAPGTFSGLFGGVNKITFVKTSYDSVLGTSFFPKRYTYTMPWVTNGVLRQVRMERTVLAPDIIFTAGDITFPGPAPFQETLARESGFITYGDAVSPGTVNGNAEIVVPSVITPEMVVTLNNSGQVFYNYRPGFADQDTSIGEGFIWGSFSGATNAPIAFPNDTSIADIEAEVVGPTGQGFTNIGTYIPPTGSNTVSVTTSP